MGSKDILYISHPAYSHPVIYGWKIITSGGTVPIILEPVPTTKVHTITRGKPICIGFIRPPDRFDIVNPSSQQIYSVDVIRRSPRR